MNPPRHEGERRVQMPLPSPGKTGDGQEVGRFTRNCLLECNGTTGLATVLSERPMRESRIRDLRHGGLSLPNADPIPSFRQATSTVTVDRSSIPEGTMKVCGGVIVPGCETHDAFRGRLRNDEEHTAMKASTASGRS